MQQLFFWGGEGLVLLGVCVHTSYAIVTVKGKYVFFRDPNTDRELGLVIECDSGCVSKVDLYRPPLLSRCHAHLVVSLTFTPNQTLIPLFTLIFTLILMQVARCAR